MHEATLVESSSVSLKKAHGVIDSKRKKKDTKNNVLKKTYSGLHIAIRWSVLRAGREEALEHDAISNA